MRQSFPKTSYLQNLIAFKDVFALHKSERKTQNTHHTHTFQLVTHLPYPTSPNPTIQPFNGGVNAPLLRNAGVDPLGPQKSHQIVFESGFLGRFFLWLLVKKKHDPSGFFGSSDQTCHEKSGISMSLGFVKKTCSKMRLTPEV